MARYKQIDTGLKLLPVDLSRQLLPGTFEHALSHLLDHELDLRALDERFRNDETGAPAYAPSVLLKVILFAYSRGMVSSRAIEQACRENVVFMAAYFTERDRSFREIVTDVGMLHEWGLILRQSVTLSVKSRSRSGETAVTMA